MAVASEAGSPGRIAASRAASASLSASACAWGTTTRRMAVHFWPALTVISATASATKRSNSGLPGAASGPRIEALRLSCSAMKRVPSRSISPLDLSLMAVSAEPVKLTTSWAPSRSSRSPVEPTRSCTAPSGTIPLPTIRRNAASAR